jgi:hydrogenase 3 maturation protease
MSRPSWRASLKKAWKRPSANDSAWRVAILGLGSEEWGDDAAGLWVARYLGRRQQASPSEELNVIEAGSMPENFAGPLRRFSPDLVLLIDATRGGPEAGKIRWIEASEIGGVSASTHGLPLSVQAEYLRLELGCQVGLIGIEGESFNFGEPLSPSVRRAVHRVVDSLGRLCE